MSRSPAVSDSARAVSRRSTSCSGAGWNTAPLACSSARPARAKSTLVALFARAAATRGENVAIFLFDERSETVKLRSRSVGIDLQPHLDSGRILLHEVPAAQITPGELAHEVRQAVERKASVVVIDSLSSGASSAASPTWRPTAAEAAEAKRTRKKETAVDSRGVGVDAAPPGERVLLLAPLGRDATLLGRLLERAGIASVACGDMAELARHLPDGAGALLLTEEALASSAVSILLAALSVQPRWSDLPMVLLADGEPLLPASAQAVVMLRAAGTLTVLERPVRGLTLITAIQAALRARRRQYEIHDLIQSEQAARRTADVARQEAESASQIKDEFLASVTHELRTPLSAILLWTRLLGRGRLDERQVQRALVAVERSAEAQSKLIEDLLDVSRMTLGKLHLNLQELELAPVVHAAIDVLRPAAEARCIGLEAALDPQAGLVRGDPDRLQQVIWNLLSNAVKFTPPGGRISIRLERKVDHVRLEVADTGKGISQEFMPHVFERFRQANATAQRLQGGLGIGLAICRQLIELHGGTIRADSPGEGLGTVMTVELRLATPVSKLLDPEQLATAVEPLAAQGS